MTTPKWYTKPCKPTRGEPDGYLEWHYWALGKQKTHNIKKCKKCKLWHVWEKKNDK